MKALMIKNMTAPAPPAPPKINKHFGDPAQKFLDYIVYSISLAYFSNFRASIAIYYDDGSKFSLFICEIRNITFTLGLFKIKSHEIPIKPGVRVGVEFLLGPCGRVEGGNNFRALYKGTLQKAPSPIRHSVTRAEVP